MSRYRRCSNCRRSGHNRATCPDLPKYEKERAASLRKTIPRQCKFCKESGHNRATCAKLKTAKKDWVVKNNAFKKLFIKACEDNGFGVGAIVGFRDNVCVVSEFLWGQINLANPGYNRLGLASSLKDFSMRQMISFGFIKNSFKNTDFSVFGGLVNKYHPIVTPANVPEREFRIITPVTFNRNTIPEGWLDYTDPELVDNYFAEHTVYNY